MLFWTLQHPWSDLCYHHCKLVNPQDPVLPSLTPRGPKSAAYLWLVQGLFRSYPELGECDGEGCTGSYELLPS